MTSHACKIRASAVILAAALVLAVAVAGGDEPNLPPVNFLSLKGLEVGWAEFPQSVVTEQGLIRPQSGFRFAVIPVRGNNQEPANLVLSDLDFVALVNTGARYSPIAIAWDSIFAIPPEGCSIRLMRPCPRSGETATAKLLFIVPESVTSLQLHVASPLGKPLTLPGANSQPSAPNIPNGAKPDTKT